MSSRLVLPLVLTVACLNVSSAQAHFLWIVSSPDSQTPAVNVYFSESASPDDPDLLDRVLKAEAWVLGGRRGNEPTSLQLKKQGNSLVAELPDELRDAPVVMRHTYGAVTRGGESFLLKYYAKSYARALPGTWRSVRDPELLPLEILPQLADTGLSLTVLWNGKPQSGAAVTIEGPGLEKKLEGTTDVAGMFKCSLSDSGLFSIRAKHVEPTAGDYSGTPYKSIRHYSTLALRYQPSQIQSVNNNWPALSKGVTSFGGAVVGDSLYMYGGHYGQAHQYSRDQQSGDFSRLNLRDPQGWEPLPGGPKLTGLALVAHNGKLYRIGGFAAMNDKSEEERLVSQAAVARFDPDTNRWESLPPLPESRSSHDAAVVGDTLFVAGGWNMQPGTATVWHGTAWSLNLAAEAPAWEAVLQPPIRRRALALAAWNDKLYCVGGMDQSGRPTTATTVFDVTKREWRSGPTLLGSGMDGFGSSAFSCGGRLYATTMSGSVQRLSAAGDQWEFVGQLQHPRFFHRLLPWKDDRLVVAGGASMSTGKVTVLELLPISSELAITK